MKATVIEKECVGCGLCSDACPEVFEIVSGIAKVKATPVPASAEKECKQAAEDCPVTAIKVEE